LLVGTPVKAGEMVLGIEAGMGVFGPSGVSTVDKLERDEIASTSIKGAYLGYQSNAWGGRWRIEGGVEHTDADGDWGVHQTNGDLARQTVQIAATSFKVGAAYDFKQTGDIFPFVGAGVSLNLNRPENSTVIELAGGGESGCLSDNSDTSSFGYYGKAGVGYDISDRVTMRAFYQYTDRGTAQTGGDGCPAGYDGYTVSLKDHSIRVSFGVRF
jgi:opacity protein-like surface antigen